ncbi:hypothetical protein C8J56DRAFT_1066524 [Mycena floridula]|nr:hypothetical protein C8J56DRAFT_1066524 [Mycena floridula]
MYDKGKAPSTDPSTVPVSQEVLMAILYRIDALTAQVADLALVQSGARADAALSAQAAEPQEEKDDNNHVEDAETSDAEKSDAEKSVDDDDRDTVVVPPHPSACWPAPAGPSTSVADLNPHFLTCPNCQHRFPPPPPRENWYVITRGTQVGIFQDWNIVARHVVGVRGAVFKRYGTRAEAEAAFNAALASNSVQVIA